MVDEGKLHVRIASNSKTTLSIKINLLKSTLLSNTANEHFLFLYNMFNNIIHKHKNNTCKYI